MQNITISWSDFWSSSCADFYWLAPLDGSTLVDMSIVPEEGEEFVLWVPQPISARSALVQAAHFQEGAGYGYYEVQEWGVTPVMVANRVWQAFSRDLLHGGSYEWVVGSILGGLTRLMQEDHQLALVGMAHVCWLVSVVPGRMHREFYQALEEAGEVHTIVMKAYRERVRALKEQGVVVAEAWRLALSGPNGKP